MSDSQTEAEEKKPERASAQAWQVSFLLVPEFKKDVKERRILNLQLLLLENSGPGQNCECGQLHPVIQEWLWENLNNTVGTR